ncbi:MAG TPA: ATP-binding protein [Phycisphaerae bacterium]|nr:ATP-binding protein [Phycisphaerae bacterium]
MDHATTTLKIPSEVDDIRIVQDTIMERMHDAGFNGDSCFAVKLALEESLVNAVKHGNHFDPKRSVTIQYAITPDCVRISVKDEGAGFDPQKVPDPTAVENLTKPSGRGIMLMRAYMDEVTYGDGGRSVTLVKKKR